MAINFVKSDDIRILRDIEQYYSTQIDEMPMNGELIFSVMFLVFSRNSSNHIHHFFVSVADLI